VDPETASGGSLDGGAPNRDPNTTCHKRALLWPKLGAGAGAREGVPAGVAKRAREVFAAAEIGAISRHCKGIVAWQYRCAGDIGAPRRDGSMRLLMKSLTTKTIAIEPTMALTIAPSFLEPAR